MHTEIGRLNPRKATTFKNIPAKLLKSSSEICSESMQLIFNDCVQNGLFPDLLKLADVTPLHKKEEKARKKNYRSVSVLPTVSKVFERLLDKQIIDYMGPYLSSLFCGFRKGYTAQHVLVRMLEKWKTSLDNGANIGAILMDLSQAFECSKDFLFLAKLSAYGFSREALRLVSSSLENRHQRVKINGSFSAYKQLSLGVPQGSGFGPLFFNIYINDLLLSIQDTDICNYADDTTIYTCDNNLDNVIARLENDSNIIIQWFADNFMKLNTDKCNLLIIGRNSNQQITVNVGDSVVENTEDETLLGAVIDKRILKHISVSCVRRLVINFSPSLAYLDTWNPIN